MTLLDTAAGVLAALRQGKSPGAGSRNGRSYVFTSLTPICAGRRDGLVAYLDDLPMGRESPLARLPYVHFARWLVIDHLKTDWSGAPREPTRLKSQYLLFTANVTAPEQGSYGKDLPGSFLRDLAGRIPGDADAIWGNCFGYPGSESVEKFVAYLTRSQLDTLLFYVGYPNRTAEEVTRALAVQDRLVAFARRHQDDVDPARLQQAYLEESATWPWS